MSEPLHETIAGQPLPHESAHLHVSGEAVYTDDVALPANTLHAALGMSTVAHARIRSLDLSAVRACAGVVDVATGADVPAQNNFGAILHDDPIFADTLVRFAGQALFGVAATSYAAARRAARLARVEYEELPAILDVRQALAAGSFVLPTHTIRRGEPEAGLADAPYRLQGSLVIGGQEHFYLEGQVAVALPQEDGTMLVLSSTQHPTEVQHAVAHALGRRSHHVTVQCRRLGGGFGGKESQPAQFACAAAVLAARTQRPVKLRLDRDADMLMTGKRHDFLVDYDVGFDAAGRIRALKLMLAARCGHSADLSGPVNDRALCHVDNCYFLEHVEVVSHRCRTNTTSNTAFRGFGGPQGMMAIEAVIDDIARHLRRDPLEVRRANFYGTSERNVTHYQMTVEDNVIERIVDELEASSQYGERRSRIAQFNATSPVIKRGIALTPVKFGISFNATQYNQAGALVHVYTDGSVLVNHGGTEMGQGLYTKVEQVVATELGVGIGRVRSCATDTSKVPNTSATAASSGSDLNGKAAQAAARAIKERLTAFAVERYRVPPASVRFEADRVHVAEQTIDFAALVDQAYAARIALSATGYYRTPKIHWDRATLSGRPFFYFAYGAAVSEVAIDTLTGEFRLLRADLLHDVGRSLNPALDIGQIEGGFLQGAGWLTTEELWWDEAGRLRTHAPSTYKIPAAGDWPLEVRVRLLESAPNREDTIFHSKAVGEPPLMLAISVFHAIRDAVASCAPPGARLQLSAPATPESILHALAALQPSEPIRARAAAVVGGGG
ncbi:MAG TPA: xanthine dehydrogenase molybdopterin binding subunit [Burkholderiales bacterium]|nr:xanthine dehydrogenase molybdopterin binding subunit [Burkholderiales bacterium]